jgi:hypothetical protein
LNYMYGTLRSVDTVTNRVYVGGCVFRTSASLAQEVRNKKMVGMYVKVRFSFGRMVDRANEITKEVGHHDRELSTSHTRIDR